MVRFSKLTGAGNDFVAAVPGPELDARGAEQARRLCSRRTGVGVDGLILVYPRDEGVRVRFFNPDGSEFSTCGNGTRCAARFAVQRGLVAGGPFDVLTDAGPIEARVDVAADRVSLEYRMPAGRRGPIPVDIAGTEIDGWLIDFGVPHFVVPLESMPGGAIEPICAPIRSDPRLGPEGANVNLIALREAGSGRIRTFERGVEGETLACGSGSMAAVIATRAIGEAARKVDLDVRGGETLCIELVGEPVFDGTPIRVRLDGPAEPVFDGEFPGIDDE